MSIIKSKLYVIPLILISDYPCIMTTICLPSNFERARFYHIRYPVYWFISITLILQHGQIIWTLFYNMLLSDLPAYTTNKTNFVAWRNTTF